MPVHWNFRDVLNLYPEDDSFSCVASDESPDVPRRCSNAVEIRDRIAAGTVLDDIDGSTSHEAIFKGLEELSWLTLCKKHQHNIAKPHPSAANDAYSDFKEVFKDRWTAIRRENSRNAVEGYRHHRMRGGLQAIADDEDEDRNSPNNPATMTQYFEEKLSQHGKRSPMATPMTDKMSSRTRDENYRRQDATGHQIRYNPIFGSTRSAARRPPIELEEENAENVPSLRVLIQSALVPSPPETPIQSMNPSIHEDEPWNSSTFDSADSVIDSYFGDRREPERTKAVPNREARFSFEPGRDECRFNTRHPSWVVRDPVSQRNGSPLQSPPLLSKSETAIPNSPPIPVKSPRRLKSSAGAPRNSNIPRNYMTPTDAPPMPCIPPMPPSPVSPDLQLSTQQTIGDTFTKDPSAPISSVSRLSTQNGYEQSTMKDTSVPVSPVSGLSTQHIYEHTSTKDTSAPVSPVSRLSTDHTYERSSIDDISPLTSRNSSIRSKTASTLPSPYQHWFQHSPSTTTTTTTAPSPQSPQQRTFLNSPATTAPSISLSSSSSTSSSKKAIPINVQLKPALPPPTSALPPIPNLHEHKRNGSKDRQQSPFHAPASVPEDNFDYFNASLHLTPYAISYSSLQPDAQTPRVSSSRPRPSLSTIHSVPTIPTIPTPNSVLRKTPKETPRRHSKRNSTATVDGFEMFGLEPKSTFSSISGDGKSDKSRSRWLIGSLSMKSKVNQSLAAKKRNTEKEKEFVKYTSVGVFGAARLA
ncbi:uncharacterized protein BP5553_04598 [Venustampulla echinocandica]|uniref:Uncharacterized protein n=1 Tax=Venustampulla echinocandica TaxID=2656787 RepID=A0A370TNR2_9HELO|nr:uncharacterized protein BP5553_04598 [Venustampulla echinocandica]RDL37165.1 hypothetical protein BP5553_04598 [Venustampulla echinocandica]